MTDDNTPADETTELEASTPAPTHERRTFDRRSAGIAAGALLALALAFLAGLAIADHGHHGRSDERMMQVRGERGGMGFGGRGGERGDRMYRGAPGMPGGPGMDGGARGGGGPFGSRGHGGGVMGVVTKASSTELTVDPLRGGDASNAVTVKLGSDTKVYTLGSNGREDAKASDIATGAIVGVRSKDSAKGGDSSSITASAVMILRAADA